jgi:SAM-dependent methyltransferase
MFQKIQDILSKPIRRKKKFSVREQKKEYKKLQFKYRKNASPHSFDWDWDSINYNRIALVNLLISLKGSDCNYLEIGCDKNELFNSVFCQNKIGVDPGRGGTIRKTSDDFFLANKEQFDVIFVDGLHVHAQVRQDIINALKCLKKGGWICFHDCLPANWLEQNIPQLQGDWTGDVWKLTVELANTKDIDFRIFEIDYGIGVLRARVDEPKIVDMGAELEPALFDYFYEKFNTLPVCSWIEGLEWIKLRENGSI